MHALYGNWIQSCLDGIPDLPCFLVRVNFKEIKALKCRANVCKCIMCVAEKERKQCILYTYVYCRIWQLLNTSDDNSMTDFDECVCNGLHIEWRGF